MERLNGAALAKIDAIVASHKGEPGPCIVMLHDVQNELGYVPFEAMEKIAEACGTSVAEVYGVVMFYAQFTTEPKGKHVIETDYFVDRLGTFHTGSCMIQCAYSPEFVARAPQKTIQVNN